MTDADMITLTRAEYENLIDARDHAVAMRDIASGAAETFNGTEVDTYLAATRPLAFWRRHGGFTHAALAARVGIAQSSLVLAETSCRGLKVETYA